MKSNSFSLIVLLASILLGALDLSSAACSAQEEEPSDPSVLPLPECDIFLFDLKSEEGKLSIANGKNVTARKGYDNQPWFTPDSKSFLFTKNEQPDRTDVYEYFIESAETKQVTDSPDQEYSPQISPDNKTLSYVTDGKTANQSIWSIDRAGADEKWLLGNQGDREPVGYYSWNHKTGHILFWSRYGFSIRLVHESKKLSHFVTGNAVPSSPYIIPGTDRFSFVHHQTNGQDWIKELDPETLAVRPLVAMPSSNRNYGWTPGGNILLVDGDELKTWSEASKEDGWQVIANITEHDLKSATRVAVSPDGKRLAIVGLPKSVSYTHLTLPTKA